MITNERQYRITRAEISRFQDAIKQAAESPSPGVHPRLHQAMIDGLRSQLDDLRRELAEYDALREGKVKRRVFTSLLDPPNALIEGRIVKRLTQKQLGSKLGVPEQQVQRYERTQYAGASFERLQEVADALGIRFKKTVEYDIPRSTARRSAGSRKAASVAGSSLSQRKSASSSTKGGVRMAGKSTGKAAASAAGKTLASKTTSKTAKRAAASDLAQVKNTKVTSPKAASAAAKTLASKTTSKGAKKAAASDLAQVPRKSASQKRS
jgi:transcriptional regulator with XRE-family HTH domain